MEVATFIRLGYPIKTNAPLPDSLRLRINVVNVKMSPDFRSSWISVSTLGDLAEKRKAFAWLVAHSKKVKHALAMKLKHMKCIPDIYFQHVDITARMKTVESIERASRELEQDNGSDMDKLEIPLEWASSSSSNPRGIIGGLDFDSMYGDDDQEEEEDDDDYDDDDDDDDDEDRDEEEEDDNDEDEDDDEENNEEIDDGDEEEEEEGRR
jgi:ribosome-binding factor A